MTAPVPDPTLAEGLALLISCTEIAQDEHGDAGTLMYEPAKRLADALLASDWLREFERKVAERTWRAGYVAGWGDHMRGSSNIRNPHSKGATR